MKTIASRTGIITCCIVFLLSSCQKNASLVPAVLDNTEGTAARIAMNERNSRAGRLLLKSIDFTDDYSFGGPYVNSNQFEYNTRAMLEKNNFSTGQLQLYKYNRMGLTERIINTNISGSDNGFYRFYYGNWHNWNKPVKAELDYGDLNDAPADWYYFSYGHEGNLSKFQVIIGGTQLCCEIRYKYDCRDNLVQMDFYLPDAGISTSARQTLQTTAARNMINKFTPVKNMDAAHFRSSGNSTFSNIPLVLAATTYIKPDNKINPLYQQNSILFYINTYQLLNVQDYANCMSKSNPLEYRIVYSPGTDSQSEDVQTFTYTYNQFNYPLTQEFYQEVPGFWQKHTKTFNYIENKSKYAFDLVSSN